MESGFDLHLMELCCEYVTVNMSQESSKCGYREFQITVVESKSFDGSYYDKLFQ